MKKLLIAELLLSTAIPGLAYAETYAEHHAARHAILREFARNKGIATPAKDARWNKLIAEAVKRGGVETISGITGSYVFSVNGSPGTFVTFSRQLDNKVRLICLMTQTTNASSFLSNTCWNWNTEKWVYSTRADESSPWVTSNVPPVGVNAAPDLTQETPTACGRTLGGGIPSPAYVMAWFIESTLGRVLGTTSCDISPPSVWYRHGSFTRSGIWRSGGMVHHGGGGGHRR